MHTNKEIKYKKIEKILAKYNIDTPEQLEKSLTQLDCLRLKGLREEARGRTLHMLDTLNKYQDRENKKESERDYDPNDTPAFPM